MDENYRLGRWNSQPTDVRLRFCNQRAIVLLHILCRLSAGRESEEQAVLPKSLRWRLPLSYAAIALLAALSLGAVLMLSLGDYYAEQERGYLEGQARRRRPHSRASREQCLAG
jgi:hypothetical protein